MRPAFARRAPSLRRLRIACSTGSQHHLLALCFGGGALGGDGDGVVGASERERGGEPSDLVVEERGPLARHVTAVRSGGAAHIPRAAHARSYAGRSSQASRQGRVLRRRQRSADVVAELTADVFGARRAVRLPLRCYVSVPLQRIPIVPRRLLRLCHEQCRRRLRLSLNHASERRAPTSLPRSRTCSCHSPASRGTYDATEEPSGPADIETLPPSSSSPSPPSAPATP